MQTEEITLASQRKGTILQEIKTRKMREANVNANDYVVFALVLMIVVKDAMSFLNLLHSEVKQSRSIVLSTRS